MVITVDQRPDGARCDAARRCLLLRDGGKALPLHAGDFGFVEGGVAHDVGHQVQRRQKVGRQRRHVDRADIHRRAGIDRCAQPLLLGRDVERGPGFGPFVQQAHHQRLRSGLGRAVGGVARIESDRHADLRDRGPACQRDGNAVRQGRGLHRREDEFAHRRHRRIGARRALFDGGHGCLGIGRGRRHGAFIAPAAHLCAVLGPLARLHHQRIGRARQPGRHRGLYFCRIERGDFDKVFLVRRRIAGIEQPFGQNRPLAIHAPYSFQLADLRRNPLRRRTGQFVFGRPFCHQPGDDFV